MAENYVTVSNFKHDELVLLSSNFDCFPIYKGPIAYGKMEPKSRMYTNARQKYVYVTWYTTTGENFLFSHPIMGEKSELIYKHYIPPYPKVTDDIFEALDRLEVRLKTPPKKKKYGNV